LALGGLHRARRSVDSLEDRLETVENLVRGMSGVAAVWETASDLLAERVDALERQNAGQASGVGRNGIIPPRAMDAETVAVEMSATTDEIPAAWRARISVLAPRRGGAVMIDRGGRDGLRSGDRLLVYRNGAYLGDLRATPAVFEAMAVCRPEGGGGFRVGDWAVLDEVE